MADCILTGGGGSGGYEFTMSNNGYFRYPANVVVPANVTTLGAGSSAGGFNKHTEIETITFEDPSVVTALSSSVCEGCTNLVSFEIPPNITAISISAFRDTAISNITIPANITNIGESAFRGCPVSNITWNTADSSVNIGQYAFSHSGITEAGIAQVFAKGSEFGPYMFEYCDNLVNVTAIVPGGYMFRNCANLKSITICDSSLASHRAATYICQNCTALETAVILSGVTNVRNNAFDGCTLLENVTLPETLTTIEGSAFRNCTSLQTITLPSSITSLSSSAFSGCTSLTNITLGAGWSCACSFSSVTSLTQASLAAMLVSLADLTGASSKTLTLGSTNLAKLTEEEKAVATAKNWNLA